MYDPGLIIPLQVTANNLTECLNNVLITTIQAPGHLDLVEYHPPAPPPQLTDANLTECPNNVLITTTQSPDHLDSVEYGIAPLHPRRS